MTDLEKVLEIAESYHKKLHFFDTKLKRSFIVYSLKSVAHTGSQWPVQEIGCEEVIFLQLREEDRYQIIALT